MREVGILLSNHIDNYVNSVEPSYEVGKLERILNESEKLTGRLLHYFPQNATKPEVDQTWCGWHNDHGSLTVLLSPIYLDKKGNRKFFF